jgi:hypothetical protein
MQYNQLEILIKSIFSHLFHEIFGLIPFSVLQAKKPALWVKNLYYRVLDYFIIIEKMVDFQ